MARFSKKERNLFLREFLVYFFLFTIVKLILDRGIPESGILSILLPAIGFSVLIAVIKVFFIARKRKED